MGGTSVPPPVMKYFSEIFLQAILKSLIITLIRTLNRSSGHRMPKNYRYFENRGGNGLVRPVSKSYFDHYLKNVTLRNNNSIISVATCHFQVHGISYADTVQVDGWKYQKPSLKSEGTLKILDSFSKKKSANSVKILIRVIPIESKYLNISKNVGWFRIFDLKKPSFLNDERSFHSGLKIFEGFLAKSVLCSNFVDTFK